MKLIVAVVRPFLMEKLVVALEDIENFPGITLIQAEGFGQRIRNTLPETIDPFKPYKQIEIAAPDEMVEQIVTQLSNHANTGKKGDGLILVMPVEKTVFI